MEETLKSAHISLENVTFRLNVDLNSLTLTPSELWIHQHAVGVSSETVLFLILCAGVKAPPTMGSQQTESGARRRANAPTAPRNSPSRHCPATAPTPPPWPSCPTSTAWSTPPSTPAWRTTVSQAAPPVWPPAAPARRVSVSVPADVGVWRYPPQAVFAWTAG